jgi:hypothetical protein
LQFRDGQEAGVVRRDDPGIEGLLHTAGGTIKFQQIDAINEVV